MSVLPEFEGREAFVKSLRDNNKLTKIQINFGGAAVDLDLSDTPKTEGRQCGDCTLCCRLLPVLELGKQGNQRCRHQSASKRCRVYRQPDMPQSCQIWSCRWLVDQTFRGRRPDRSHYVVDVIPDISRAQKGPGAPIMAIPCIQIWVDPDHPNAWRDPVLRAWMEKTAADTGFGFIVRRSELPEDSLFVMPPSPSTGGVWFERRSQALPDEKGARA